MSSVTKAFVSEGALSEIVVKVLDDSVIDLLEELGFVAVSGKEQKTLSLMAPDQDIKAKLFENYEMRGFLFRLAQIGVPPTCLSY